MCWNVLNVFMQCLSSSILLSVTSQNIFPWGGKEQYITVAFDLLISLSKWKVSDAATTGKYYSSDHGFLRHRGTEAPPGIFNTSLGINFFQHHLHSISHSHVLLSSALGWGVWIIMIRHLVFNCLSWQCIFFTAMLAPHLHFSSVQGESINKHQLSYIASVIQKTKNNKNTLLLCHYQINEHVPISRG